MPDGKQEDVGQTGPSKKGNHSRMAIEGEIGSRKNVRLSRVVYEKGTEKYIMVDWRHNDWDFILHTFF